MAVSAQCLPVDPGIGYGIDDVFLAATEQAGDHGGGGDLDQDDVVYPDPIKAVFQRQHALDFVRLDHGGQNVFNRQRRLALRHAGAGNPVGRGQDAAQVVGGMAPFGGQPGVVEIQPADHGADVEGRQDGVELEGCARHLGAIGDCGARYHRPQQLGAGRVAQCLEAAAQCVHQAVAGGIKRFCAGDLGVVYVVGNVH